MEEGSSLNVNNEFISEVQHTAIIPTDTVTPPPTQVKEVEYINRIAGKGEIKFQLTNESVKKLKRNWGRKVAKQQHKQCNETALRIAKEAKAKAKGIKRFHRRIENRRAARLQRRSTEGTAVMDSGTTSTVIQPTDNKYVIDTNVPSNKVFTVATGEKAKAGNQAKLKMNLRGQAAVADMVPTLRHNSLISTSKLADANYHTVFTPNEVLVYDGEVQQSKIPVWKGWRDQDTGLWRVPLTEEVSNLNTQTKLLQRDEMMQAFQERTLSVYNLPSKAEAMRYMHAALGFPTKETLLAATRAGFLTSWPGMNVTAINKYFPESVETQKGHMKHQRQGVRSTKIPQLQADVSEEEKADIEKRIKELKQKHRDIFVQIWEEKQVVYSDQTGKFPTTSSRGNKYLMVMYYIDGSYIMMEPMKSRHENEMIRVHNILIDRLKERGFQPKKQILDNEISKAYEKSITKHGMEVERVPKEAHRRNAAEKAIQTAKNHIKAILAGCDDSFPMHLWDRLLPQVEMTCNLLRPANANPNISAYQYLYGNHDYEKHPLHPLGCKVQAFNDTKTRKSWEENSKDGYYVGTSFKHHRTYNVWIKSTRAIQNTDTAFFQHSYITNPKVTKADVVTNAANKLIEAIKGNFAAAHNESEMEALERLSKVFTDATKKMSGIELDQPAVW